MGPWLGKLFILDSNLSKRQALGIKKTEVTNKLERVTALRSNCEGLHQKYQSLADKYAPANIQVIDSRNYNLK